MDSRPRISRLSKNSFQPDLVKNRTAIDPVETDRDYLFDNTGLNAPLMARDGADDIHQFSDSLRSLPTGNRHTGD